MPERSARLNLPYIQPSQAQKHITHNEALELLDGVVQTALTAINVETPPSNPIEGSVYAIGASPTGDWAPHAGKLARRTNGGWLFIVPEEGWLAWDNAQGGIMTYLSGVWSKADGDLANLDGVGIGTSWDTTNKLALASDASLFSHNGNGHQLKLNKAGVSDTASLLYQTNWTGHAEMGLAGDNAFSLKISADGSTWYDALKADPSAQEIQVNLPIVGTAVQQSADDTTAGRLMRADYGYGPGNLLGTVSQTGGNPTGAVFERGSNANGDWVRFADGTQICTHKFDLLQDETYRCSYTWAFPMTFAAGLDTVVMAGIDNEDQGLPAARKLTGPHCKVVNTASSVIKLYGLTAFATGDTYAARATAIGRWY